MYMCICLDIYVYIYVCLYVYIYIYIFSWLTLSCEYFCGFMFLTASWGYKGFSGFSVCYCVVCFIFFPLVWQFLLWFLSLPCGDPIIPTWSWFMVSYSAGLFGDMAVCLSLQSVEPFPPFAFLLGVVWLGVFLGLVCGTLDGVHTSSLFSLCWWFTDLHGLALHALYPLRLCGSVGLCRLCYSTLGFLCVPLLPGVSLPLGVWASRVSSSGLLVGLDIIDPC